MSSIHQCCGIGLSVGMIKACLSKVVHACQMPKAKSVWHHPYACQGAKLDHVCDCVRVSSHKFGVKLGTCL